MLLYMGLTEDDYDAVSYSDQGARHSMRCPVIFMEDDEWDDMVWQQSIFRHMLTSLSKWISMCLNMFHCEAMSISRFKLCGTSECKEH